MEALDTNEIEDWIESQLKWKWPDAESVVGHENQAGDYYFKIRRDERDLWLILEQRVYLALSTVELMDFLDEEHWVDRLQTDRCLLVRLPGIQPTLVRCPDAVI